MSFFYTFNFRKRKSIIIIVTLAFFTALFFLVEQTSMYAIFSNSKSVALTKGNIKENRLALTFNISWGDEKVFDILNVLEAHEQRATFFLSGEWAERHPHIIEEILNGKHEIGMLGYRYKSYLEQDIEQVRKDLLYARDVFEKLGLKNIKYVRAPSGQFNKEIITLAEQLGYTVIHWSVNPNDWENPGVEVVTDYIVDKAGNGDIVLLHASDSAKQTAASLENVLPYFTDKGLMMVTISELVNEMTTEEKLIK